MATRQQPTSQSAGNVPPAPEKPTYSDSSGAIFSMYIDRAQTFDKENVDNWDGQANGILLFVRFCSLPISMNVICLRPSPFSDWSLLLNGGWFYRYQLPEFATRSQRHHSVSHARSWLHSCNNGPAGISRWFNGTTHPTSVPMFGNTLHEVHAGSGSLGLSMYCLSFFSYPYSCSSPDSSSSPSAPITSSRISPSQLWHSAFFRTLPSP